MSSHSHLKFLNHGEKAPPPSATTASTALGGIDIPTLQESAVVKEHDKNRSQHQKHVEVVDHLKDLCYNTKVRVNIVLFERFNNAL